MKFSFSVLSKSLLRQHSRRDSRPRLSSGAMPQLCLTENVPKLLHLQVLIWLALPMNYSTHVGFLGQAIFGFSGSA